MNARACIIPAAALAIWLAFPAPAGAHRLDEYLQTTRVAIDIDRVDLDIDLTPGASMAPQVVEWIDTNRDGEISLAEGNAYARQMIASVALSIDGRPGRVTLVEYRFPDIGDMLLGQGTIRLRATTELSASAIGRHQVSYLNSHRPEASVYLVNALVPENRRIRIARQQRDPAQHGLTVDYSVGLSNQGWLLVGFAMISTLVVSRSSRRFFRASSGGREVRHATHLV